MKITWLGHSGFRIEIEDQVLLIDPWIRENPVFPQDDESQVVQGVTAILLTHGHGDHASDVVRLAKELGVPVYGIFDLMTHWSETEGIDGQGFNKGGTVAIGNVRVTMVNAVHSSSMPSDEGLSYAGSEAGFIVRGEGHSIYVSGDTDIMADMGWIGEYHAPDIGILACGGHFTMDMEAAAWAARKFFDFKVLIPCHYKTFPVLAQSAEALVEGLPGVDVRTPGVMETLEI